MTLGRRSCRWGRSNRQRQPAPDARTRVGYGPFRRRGLDAREPLAEKERERCVLVRARRERARTLRRSRVIARRIGGRRTAGERSEGDDADRQESLHARSPLHCECQAENVCDVSLRAPNIYSAVTRGLL